MTGGATVPAMPADLPDDITAATAADTPDPELLAMLPRVSPKVRLLVAKRPALSPGLTAALQTDPAPAVRGALAKRRDLAPETLATLGDDLDPDVRAAVAANRRAPEALLTHLATDLSRAVRQAARINRGLTPAARARVGAVSEAAVVRAHVVTRAAAARARGEDQLPDASTLPAPLRQKLAKLAASPPDEAAWTRLAAALEGPALVGPALGAAVAFVDPLLRDWPDAMRVTAPRWLQRLDRDEPEPRLALARRCAVPTYTFGDALTDAFVIRLASSPWLARWTSLDLQWVATGPLGAHALSASPFVSGLRALRLDGGAITSEGLAALAQAEGLAALEALSLARCALRAEDFAALDDARFAPSLRALDLGDNTTWRPDPHTDDPPLRWTRLRALRSLRLAFNHLGDEGVRELLAGPLLGALTSLDLQANALTDVTAVALANSPWLGHLTTLNLVANHLGQRGLEALVRAPGLGSLRDVDLSNAAPCCPDAKARALVDELSARGCRVRFDIFPRG